MINVVPCGFDSDGTVVQRRKYRSDIRDVLVTIFEYNNLWWYVVDTPDLVDLRSIVYVSRQNLMEALRSEMLALHFSPLGDWEVLRHA